MARRADDDPLDELPDEGTDRPALRRGMLVGYLAMTPLLLAYEWSVRAGGGALRNACEMILSRPLDLLGVERDLGRRIALALLVVIAFALLRRAGQRIGSAVLRVILEGAAAAIVLGPLLLWLSGLFFESLPPLGLPAGPPSVLPGLERTALVFGAGAYEELLFRVGAYSALYLLARNAGEFFGLGRAAAATAEALALVLSSLAFAAFHLDGALTWLGAGGEPFDAGRFAWRALAGGLLALLFRWRGAGVAAWTHGLFNVSLLLGAGPGVFA